MKLKELRTILKTGKCPKMVVEKGIKNSLGLIPQYQLRSEKLKNKTCFQKKREIYRNLGTSKTLDKISTF